MRVLLKPGKLSSFLGCHDFLLFIPVPLFFSDRWSFDNLMKSDRSGERSPGKDSCLWWFAFRLLVRKQSSDSKQTSLVVVFPRSGGWGDRNCRYNSLRHYRMWFWHATWDINKGFLYWFGVNWFVSEPARNISGRIIRIRVFRECEILVYPRVRYKGTSLTLKLLHRLSKRSAHWTFSFLSISNSLKSFHNVRISKFKQ